RIGPLDQAFRRSLWILLPADDFEDLVRLHAARQAVGAQEHLVPLAQRNLTEFDLNCIVDSQGAGDDVLLRRQRILLFREYHAPDLFGDQRVILRQWLDRVPADQIHATVTDM